ncbi:MAG TPA: TolC family protein [Bacteroidales bacterium]|jgi:outer membrane protein TolC|nr:TolC family protein [Bacteroidales bacterium]HOT18303.1 TolC family protein [Bacteroidales bacterium]
MCANIGAQQVYDLQGCLKFALENNHNIRKAQFDKEKSAQARQEILGALLPQVSGTGNLNYNIQKSRFIMPNFMNEFLPPGMQDPNAAKYMTIEMGTNYTAGIGAVLNQQIVNLSLFNAVDIARTAEELTSLAAEAREEDVISQTANLFYAIQATEYAAGMFGRSIEIMDSVLISMETSYASGLIRKVDLDRLKVTRTNMSTQRASVINAVEVQKNLLKLQMGMDISEQLEIEKINPEIFDIQTNIGDFQDFDPNLQTSYKMLNRQQNLQQLQKKAAIYENFPVLTAMINYNYTGVSDEFFRGETNYWFGSSMAALNLRIPLFGGLSRSSKIKQANFELLKVREDEAILKQSLSMAHKNALLKLEDSRNAIQIQKANMAMAEEVYRVTERNYSQGIASMSDVLNSNSSLIQAQMSYADALNNFMKAYVELRKASGTIRELVR